jgi:hypothetical protein
VSFPLEKAVAIGALIVVGILLGLSLKDGSGSVTGDGKHAEGQRTNRVASRVTQSSVEGGRRDSLYERAAYHVHDLEQLSRVDAKQAMAYLDSITDSDQRGLALSAIGSGWGETDPEEAARWLEGLESDQEQVHAAWGLVSVWAARKPEDALAWALAREAGSALREVSLLEVADAWSRHFPRQATERFLTSPDEEGTERGMHVITTQWAVNAPEEAIRYFSSLDPARRRDEFLESVLVSLTNENPELSWREAHRLGDAGRVAHVRSQALEAMAEVQPQEALKLAAMDGDLRLNYMGIARGWAYLNREEAQAWAGSLEDLELRNEAMEEIRKYRGDGRWRSGGE